MSVDADALTCDGCPYRGSRPSGIGEAGGERPAQVPRSQADIGFADVLLVAQRDLGGPQRQPAHRPQVLLELAGLAGCRSTSGPELCGRGAISFTITPPQAARNISTATSPTTPSHSAIRAASARAASPRPPGSGRGTIERSRMWFVWRFSEAGKARVSPDCVRAQMTESSRSNSTHRSTTQRRPRNMARRRARSCCTEMLHLSLAVVAKVGGFDDEGMPTARRRGGSCPPPAPRRSGRAGTRSA